MRNKFKILLFIVSLASISQAQIIDYVQVYIGTRLYPQDLQINLATAKPDRFYAGFAPGQVLGVSAYRQLTDHFCVGASFEIGNTRKPNYNINIATIGVNVKYNFNNIESFISPYIMGGANYSFITVSQSEFKDGPYALQKGKDATTIYTDTVTYRNTKTDIFFVPVYGVHVGAGLEFKIREGWGLYGEYKFTYSFVKNAPILQQPDTYGFNKYNMIYHNIVFGLRVFL